MSKPIFMLMCFKDGTGGRRMRPEFAGKSTMDLILSGDRTATSRSPKAQKGIKKGDTIAFHDKQGRIAIVQAITDEYDLIEVEPWEWSKLECWIPEMYAGLAAKAYRQFQFKLEKTGVLPYYV